MARRISAVVVLVALGWCRLASAQDCGAPRIVGSITNRAIREASGMAASGLRDDVLWVVNDSGNSPTLYAVSTNGASLAAVRVSGVRNRDWEDLAAFRLDGVSYLLVADIGDNEARHETCSLHVIPEPDLTGLGDDGPRAVGVAWTVTFRYPDGPRDCEAVAVDVPARCVLLLSKRTAPPVLYEVPLRPASEAGAAPLTAARIASVATIPAPTAEDLRERSGRFRSQPTAADMSPDATALVVLTYGDAFGWRRAAGQAWGDVVAAAPQRIRLPDPATGVMRPRESICLSNSGRSIYVTCEGTPAPLCRVRCDAPGPLRAP